MQIYNSPARVQRQAESGLVWMEVISGAGTTGLEVSRYCPVRVRATAATTVSFDGVLAATMAVGEIIIFNSGVGQVKTGGASANKSTVTLVVTGTAFVQVAAQQQSEVESVIADPPFGPVNPDR